MLDSNAVGWAFISFLDWLLKPQRIRLDSAFKSIPLIKIEVAQDTHADYRKSLYSLSKKDHQVKMKCKLTN